MSARERFVIKILLLVARMFADDPTIEAEIKHLANSVSVDRSLRDEAA